MSFTCCRSCDRMLERIADRQDGLCSGVLGSSCYYRFLQWALAEYPKDTDAICSIFSDKKLVAMDEWLEKGKP